MRKLFFGSLVVLLSVFAFSLVTLAQGGGPGGGQRRAPSATASLPFDPHDISGVWGGQSTANLTKEEPPMTPWALAKYKSEKTEFMNPPVDGPENTDPILRCEPSSVPRSYFLTHPIEFVQTPKEILMLLESYRNFRIIYMDGRKVPDHPEGTWYGDSVGHWDGNTLVIETTNFNDRSWVDKVGHPHSDKMKLTERITRTDHDHIKMDITIDDPIAYTKPWGGTMTWTLRPASWIIEDFLCSPADEAHMNDLVRYPADKGEPKK